MEDKIKVVFVCTGNICRSPMAEAIFKHMVSQSGLNDKFEISSAGLVSYHVGERPHIGTQRILVEKNIPLDPYKRALQVNRKAIGENDYIIALDSTHERELNGLGNIHRLLEFASQNGNYDVPDPYYDDNFQEVYELIFDGCNGLINYIRQQNFL